MEIKPYNISLGRFGENHVENMLKLHGYSILCVNYRSAWGEIDIIAKDRQCVCFIEIKTRTSNTFGHPADAVTPKKRDRMVKTAQWYLHEKRERAEEYRFDVVEVIVNKETHEIEETHIIKDCVSLD